MFQATRQRLALWYTTVTAILLLFLATGVYLYVRNTLVERIDDTLNHVVEVIQRSIVIEPIDSNFEDKTPALRVNVEASFRSNADVVEDDHIDLEWFSPMGELIWSTSSVPIEVPLHVNNGVNDGETVHIAPDQLLRQVTQRVQSGRQVMGYLRVSHPWFEVTKPTRQLIWDLSLAVVLMVVAVAAIGWFLSGLAMAPVRDSYQRLKQFTADASHELRNPIAVIQTNVQVALEDPDPHLQQDQLRVVERLTRRLGRLVDDLLFLARQDGGMALLRSDVVSLLPLIQEVVEEQQTIAPDKEITIQCIAKEGQNATYRVQGDRDQLSRLFTNLISNAVKYTPTDGKIEVILQRLKATGTSQIQVQVKDTGLGIPEDSLPHLFDRFYRVDPARSSVTSGTTNGSGLGLAIAKVIVENHHGHIQVESVPNQGSTFSVVFPAQRADNNKSIAPLKEAPSPDYSGN